MFSRDPSDLRLCCVWSGALLLLPASVTVSDRGHHSRVLKEDTVHRSTASVRLSRSAGRLARMAFQLGAKNDPGQIEVC